MAEAMRQKAKKPPGSRKKTSACQKRNTVTITKKIGGGKLRPNRENQKSSKLKTPKGLPGSKTSGPTEKRRKRRGYPVRHELQSLIRSRPIKAARLWKHRHVQKKRKRTNNNGGEERILKWSGRGGEPDCAPGGERFGGTHSSWRLGRRIQGESVAFGGEPSPEKGKWRWGGGEGEALEKGGLLEFWTTQNHHPLDGRTLLRGWHTTQQKVLSAGKGVAFCFRKWGLSNRKCIITQLISVGRLREGGNVQKSWKSRWAVHNSIFGISRRLYKKKMKNKCGDGESN